MAAKEINAGTVIVGEGQVLNAIHIITNGSVRAAFPGGEIVLKKGDIIGLCDIAYDSHFFTYTAAETVSLLSFPVKSKSTIRDLCKANPDVSKMLFTSMVNQVLAILMQYARMKEDCRDIYGDILGYYEKYTEVCAKNGITSRSLPQFDNFLSLTLEDDIEDWLLGYYASYREFTPEIRSSLPGYPAYIAGFVNRASTDIHSAFSVIESMNDYYVDKMSIFMQESSIDMFDLYTSLFFRLPAGAQDVAELKDKIEEIIEYIKGHPGIDTDMVYERVSTYRTRLQGMSSGQPSTDEEKSDENAEQELTGSLDIILEYSGVDEAVANNMRGLVNKYKKLSDKASTDDDARRLRLELTKCFYQVYSEAFMMSVRDYYVPTIMKMFFNFGYVDEELAGAESANYLYRIADTFKGDASLGVYTAYEWLKAIYDLDKDPSRNEFDTDYLAHLHELRVAGKIKPDDETRLAGDANERLKFELENMFPMVNKVTYGRLTTFCPIFSEHNIIKPLPSCLVNVNDILRSLEKIQSIDYGAFYRETIYTNDKAGISKEFVAVKVTPDIILMPNIGTRGVMWQEIEGRKRTTPARFMISVFHLEDQVTTLARLIGEYRWEMCKRVQGARWNDVTDRSLTSEYFDYIQFYRKNNDLSQEAKEKIKQSLIKCKNSFKEMFVRDYITWVLFEGNGSPRLNKIVRVIMCTYCPFPYELRKKIAENPLFKETLEHYEVKIAQKVHHLDNVIQKLKSAGVQVPDEILEQKDYVEGK